MLRIQSVMVISLFIQINVKKFEFINFFLMKKKLLVFFHIFFCKKKKQNMITHEFVSSGR